MSNKKPESKGTETASWSMIGRSTKETIESIIIAFILAFVFRAFIVEAYRIPTGSMAPTLYGAHQQTRCPDCGYDYAFEIQQRPPRITVCPNCKWLVRTSSLTKDGVLQVDGGDRILVMKLGYELADMFPSLKSSLGPNRWDVVVFKNPSNPDVNFIKRLIGLPGEKIELVDGDVYVNDKIARKTDIAKKSLWMLVYDNDYLPTRRGDRVDPRDLPGWVAVDKTPLWGTSGRVLTFRGNEKNQSGAVEFNGPIHDFYGYDDPDMQAAGRHYVVSDVKLEFMLNVNKGEGEFDLVLSKRDDVFIARIDTQGKAKLLRTTRSDYLSGKANPTVLMENSFPAISPESPRIVRFENLDYRVQLAIDDHVVLQTTDAQYSPNIKKLRYAPVENNSPIVRVSAKNIDLELWHVSLMRDIYYRFVQIQTPTDIYNPLQGKLGHGVAGNAIQLGPADYYVLGDNSPESMDSRLWYEVGPHLTKAYNDGRYQIGTVPADQMVGEAFFVYWPAWLRILQSGLPIVPNVGEMRFIR